MKSKHKYLSYGLDFEYVENWLLKEEADALFEHVSALDWQSEKLLLFGKLIEVPRKVIWMADPLCCYAYSNLKHVPVPWTDLMSGIRNKLKIMLHDQFNGVLCNYYRDGNDYMGWHSDDEVGLGSTIASISLGVSRRFCFRYRKQHSLKDEIILSHGSLLIMRGNTQRFWQHQLPKMRRVNSPRINLTFRIIHPAES